jgi:hypothetical protein
VNGLLVPLTLATTALVVLALVVYLSAIAAALHRARANVRQIADGLEAIAGHSAPLPERLGAINGVLVDLLAGLRVADSHVRRAARVFKLDV